MSRRRSPPRLPDTAKAADPEERSRSQKKRESLALQELGERLARQPASVVRRLDLPAELLEAVLEFQSMSSREARRRQNQYIGKLMREADWPAIAGQLDALDAPQRAATTQFHHLERLRDAILAASPEALASLIAPWPQAAARLRELAGAARAEQATQQPPHAGRALFSLLRELDTGKADGANIEPASGQGRP